jgi:hypothetical protein
MFKINLLSLLIFLSVLVFAMRIYSRINSQHLFTKKSLTKIGTSHYFFLFLIYIKYFSQPFCIWFYSFLSFIFIPAIIFAIKKTHQHRFYGDFLRFLSVVILKMQVGHSFQSSLELALTNEKWKHREVLKHIFENVVFTQQEVSRKSGPFASFVDRILKEFSLIQSNQHQAIDRLCNFRNNLRAELFFSRKSRQIWIYFGYQLLILSSIYILILIFIVREYGFIRFQAVFFLSFTCYFMGIFSVYILGRKKHWHI